MYIYTSDQPLQEDQEMSNFDVGTEETERSVNMSNNHVLNVKPTDSYSDEPSSLPNSSTPSPPPKSL